MSKFGELGSILNGTDAKRIDDAADDEAYMLTVTNRSPPYVQKQVQRLTNPALK